MKKIVIVALLTVLTLVGLEDETKYKIIYLISPPRSLSTCFLRWVHARGDFTVINEPSWYAFDLTIFNPEMVKPLFNPDTPSTFEEVKEKIYTAAQTSHVFVKEISFSVAQFLLDDDEFIKNPQVHFVFLIRDPHASLLSFYKKQLTDIPLEKFGYRGCSYIFDRVKSEAVHEPIIILAEDLSTNTEETLSLFCEKIGIPFVPQTLSWQSLGENFDGQTAWHDDKKPFELYHWHGDAIRSTGFGRLSSYKVDAQGQPTFEEVINERDRAVLLAGYEFNVPFYRMLCNEKNFLCRKNIWANAQQMAEEWLTQQVVTASLSSAHLIVNYLYYIQNFLEKQLKFKEVAEQYDTISDVTSYADASQALYEYNNAQVDYKRCYEHLESHPELMQAITQINLLQDQFITKLVTSERSTNHTLQENSLLITPLNTLTADLQLLINALQSYSVQSKQSLPSNSFHPDITNTLQISNQVSKELQSFYRTILTQRQLFYKQVYQLAYQMIYSASQKPVPRLFDHIGIDAGGILTLSPQL